MNNADVRQADCLLRQVFTVIDNRSIWDIKQKYFEEIKVKLYKVLLLIDRKPRKVNMRFINYSVQLENWFNENYPKWQLRLRSDESRIPRQLLQYFFTTHTRLSLKEIGALTGGYDHTTILNSKRVVKNMIDTKDPAYCEIYNKVIEFLNGLKQNNG